MILKKSQEADDFLVHLLEQQVSNFSISELLLYTLKTFCSLQPAFVYMNYYYMLEIETEKLKNTYLLIS